MGLSLIHAGFLAAGLAVGLPIVIHLLLRQKTRTVPIGSVRFLHQVVREHRRRRRLRQWLLLALRMLAVLLLAALFARPYWDESYRRGLETEVVLLLDRSASMSTQDSGGQSAFEDARNQILEELKRVDENTVVHVALCDAAGVEEIAIERLTDARTTVTATDYQLAVSWASDVLAASQRAHRQVMLATDLQASGLPPAQSSGLAQGIEFRVCDVGQSLRRNLAIDSVEAIRTEIHPQSRPTLRVVLRNHSPLAARQIAVHCAMKGPDGPITATKSVDVAAQGSAVIDLPLTAEKDGLYQGEVTIAPADDALALDNRRYVAFEARHPDRVLLVDGQEGRAIFNSETYFLETALRLPVAEVDGSGSSASPGIMRSFEPERIVWESGNGFPRLDGFRAIVLANVRRLSSTDGERLRDFVSGGGSLLLFAGDQVSRESLAPLAELGMLPGELATEPVEGKLRVDEWNVKHPALACFADPQQGDMGRVEYHKLLPLTKTAGDANVLWHTSGHIAAAERSVGRGRVVYVGSTADRDWTDLPRMRMYVPLVRQLLAYLTDQLAERALVTNRLVTKADDKLGIAPDSTKGNQGRWLVTNLDPRESALDRVTQEELIEALGISTVTSDDPAKQASLSLMLPRDALRADEIWTSVAWVLLVVLVLETLLAGRVHA
jgi:hypothetical protein